MADIIREEIRKLYDERVIDNREVTMIDALTEFMPDATVFDMAVGYFYISGFEFVRDVFQKLMAKPEAKLRVLMGNETSTSTLDVLSAGLSPEAATLKDVNQFEKENAHVLHDVSKWMHEGRLQVKVYTGEANYFHAKSYLFQEDQHGLKGTAIVGSSNFSKAGLSGNTELNTLSRDNYRSLRRWFDSIWESDEVRDFSPELIKAVDKKKSPLIGKTDNYIPGIATYMDFARMYAKPPLQIGTGGVWDKLYPHQKTGVAECVNRIRQYGTALLCDGVGLGKTRAAAGIIHEIGAAKTLLLASTKLHEQWRNELKVVGVSMSNIHFMSKESLARMNAAELRGLAQYELVVIDEAHQGFKNSGRKMYRNLQYVLAHSKVPIKGLLLTATPWNNSRVDVFHLGRLFLNTEKVSAGKKYAEYLRYAPRKAGKAFEFDDEAFADFWEDLFLQRTRKTYGGKEVTFAKRRFPTVEIVYEPQKQQALEDNFERISKLHLPYMDPLRYTGEEESQLGQFTSDRLKLLFLKRADSSWNAFQSTLESIYKKLEKFVDEIELILKDENEVKKRFHRWISSSYGLNKRLDDFTILMSKDEEEDLTDFELNSRENRARYVRKMAERIDSIDKRQAKRMAKEWLQDALEDIRVLNLIRSDLLDAFNRIDEKYEAVRDAIIQCVEKKEKILIISQFRDTTIDYFNKLTHDPKLSSIRIGHVTGRSEDCYVNTMKNIMTKEDILTRFSPVAKQAEYFVGSDEEIDIVVGTETLAVGQNLQDSHVLMNLDLPYNPMVLEQRIGRIDRPRQDGQVRNVDIFTFPSIPVIEAELKMTERLRQKLEGIFQDTRFDDLVLPEYEDFLRRILTERGAAVENMLDETIDRQIVPVDAKSHSAEYVEAQERMWSYIERNETISIPQKPVLIQSSISKPEHRGKTVAIVKTILKDVNGQEIETIRKPLLVKELESDLVRVEAEWHESIQHSAVDTSDIEPLYAKSLYENAKQQLLKWTALQVERYNAHIGAKRDIKGQLIESKSKKVASDIISAAKGPNRIFIVERIKSAGKSPKILRALSSAIEYIDSRDPEYGDVLDLYEDLNRLWNDFSYYTDRFLEQEVIDHQNSDTETVNTNTGRLASIDKSETVWEVGHLGF